MFDQNVLKETFSALSASEHTLTEVLKMTTQRKRHGRVWRALPVAAAIAVLLVTTAFAVVGFTIYENPQAMIRAFFGENGAVQSEGIVEHDETGNLTTNIPGWERVPVDETLADELISNYISAETGTISWEGYTLTLEANLYDSLTGTGILYYTLENPDGVTGYQVWGNGSVWCNPQTISFTPALSWASESYLDEALSTDTKVYFYDYYIKHGDSDLEMSIWSYADVEYKGTAKINVANTSNMVGLTCADGSVLISPIGICIHEEALGVDLDRDIRHVVLRYGDGSEYVLLDDAGFVDNSMYALGQGGDGPSDPYRTTYVFNRIVDISSLVEIVIDDVTIPVNEDLGQP